MAKNPLITDKVRRVIAEIYLEHPDCRAKEIRDRVEARLHKQNLRSKPGWPGISAVQKELTKIRANLDKRPPEVKELDKPFSLGTLVKYPIPPEALPTVLEAWAHYRKGTTNFTIREALWFARLSGALSLFEKVGDKDRSLANLVIWYAIRESAYEAIGEDIDTTDLDTGVLGLLKLEEEKEEDKNRLPLVYEWIQEQRAKIALVEKPPTNPVGFVDEH